MDVRGTEPYDEDSYGGTECDEMIINDWKRITPLNVARSDYAGSLPDGMWFTTNITVREVWWSHPRMLPLLQVTGASHKIHGA